MFKMTRLQWKLKQNNLPMDSDPSSKVVGNDVFYALCNVFRKSVGHQSKEQSILEKAFLTTFNDFSFSQPCLLHHHFFYLVRLQTKVGQIQLMESIKATLGKRHSVFLLGGDHHGSQARIRVDVERDHILGVNRRSWEWKPNMFF